MVDDKQNVMLTGLPGGCASRLMPSLEALGFATRHVADPKRAVESIAAMHFTVVIVGYPVAGTTIPDFVAAMRSRTSKSVNSGLALMTYPRHLQDARKFIGHGVNKVLEIDATSESVGCVVNILANPRNPLAQRHSTRLPIRVTVAGVEQKWLIEDISAGGLLIIAAAPPKIGERFSFVLEVPGGEIEGEAKVVRHTHPGRESAQGFGARFCAFSGSGRATLAALLRSLTDGQAAG